MYCWFCFLEKQGGPPSGLDSSSGLAGPSMQFDFLKEGVVPLGALSALRAQCTRSATIWASGRTGDPCFEIIGASLLPCCVGFDAFSTLRI